MKFELKYNRLHILDLYDEDWIIDRNGNLIMREETNKTQEESIPIQTIKI